MVAHFLVVVKLCSLGCYNLSHTANKIYKREKKKHFIHRAKLAVQYYISEDEEGGEETLFLLEQERRAHQELIMNGNITEVESGFRKVYNEDYLASKAPETIHQIGSGL